MCSAFEALLLLIFLYSPSTPKNETKNHNADRNCIAVWCFGGYSSRIFQRFVSLFFICFGVSLLPHQNQLTLFFHVKGSWYWYLTMCRRFPPVSVLFASTSSKLCIHVFVTVSSSSIPSQNEAHGIELHQWTVAGNHGISILYVHGYIFAVMQMC